MVIITEIGEDEAVFLLRFVPLLAAGLVRTWPPGLGDNPSPARLQPPLELLVPGGELHLLQPPVGEFSLVMFV